ncbi:hypothetical protein [Micromonospora sp. NPDC003241]
MFDFFAPVKIPRSAFERLVAQVDDGVGRNAIALVLHEDFPYRALHVVDEDDFAIDRNDDFLPLVDMLDQILFFAFEQAPEGIVRSWAKGKDEELEDEAVQRVLHVRENMPNLASLWIQKSTSIVPPMIGMSHEIVRDEAGRGVAASLYLSASRISAMGRADLTSATRLRVQLWPADVNALIRELEDIRDSYLAPGEREERRDVPDGDSQQA